MCSHTTTMLKQVGSKVIAYQTRCNSWNCPECAPRRRRSMMREARDGRPNRFITLTVNPHWFSGPVERAARLAKAWRLIVAAYRHRWPNRTIEYLAVFEATKRGEPHLHIVVRGDFMSHKWLSDQMKKRMGAPIVDIRAVKGAAEVTRYIAKYISKRNIRFGTCKRYWRSAKYLAVSPSKARRLRNAGATFYVYKWGLISYARQLLAKGYKLTFSSDRTFTFDLPPWLNAPPGFWLDDGWTVKPPAAVE